MSSKKEKLSGAQNRKLKAKSQFELQKNAVIMNKYFKPINNELLASSSLTMNNSNKINNSIIDIKEVVCDTEILDNVDITINNKPVSEFSDCVTSISQIELFNPALWPDNKQNNFIDLIIKAGPAKINIEVFPKDEFNRHFSKNFQIRKVENNQNIHRRWLVYSKSSDRAFCFCCKLFNSLSSLGTIGNNDWKHMTTTLTSHEKSSKHFIAYKKWHECELRLKLGKCIDNDLQRVINSEAQHWRNVLDRLMSITLYLSKHNLAFRGSSDKLFDRNNGNFLGLVELLGKYDSVMQDHLH